LVVSFPRSGKATVRYAEVCPSALSSSPGVSPAPCQLHESEEDDAPLLEEVVDCARLRPKPPSEIYDIPLLATELALGAPVDITWHDAWWPGSLRLKDGRLVVAFPAHTSVTPVNARPRVARNEKNELLDGCLRAGVTFTPGGVWCLTGGRQRWDSKLLTEVFTAADSMASTPNGKRAAGGSGGSSKKAKGASSPALLLAGAAGEASPGKGKGKAKSAKACGEQLLLTAEAVKALFIAREDIAPIASSGLLPDERFKDALVLLAQPSRPRGVPEGLYRVVNIAIIPKRPGLERFEFTLGGTEARASATQLSGLMPTMGHLSAFLKNGQAREMTLPDARATARLLARKRHDDEAAAEAAVATGSSAALAALLKQLEHTPSDGLFSALQLEGAEGPAAPTPMHAVPVATPRAAAQPVVNCSMAVKDKCKGGAGVAGQPKFLYEAPHGTMGPFCAACIMFWASRNPGMFADVRVWQNGHAADSALPFPAKREELLGLVNHPS